jgi:hypothetical protein
MAMLDSGNGNASSSVDNQLTFTDFDNKRNFFLALALMSSSTLAQSHIPSTAHNFTGNH